MLGARVAARTAQAKALEVKAVAADARDIQGARSVAQTAKEELKSRVEEFKPDIQVLSMDADGCWFKGGQHTQLDNFIEKNPQLYTHIKSMIEKFSGQTHFICGSNRQSHYLNSLGKNQEKHNYSTPCFFEALERLASVITKESGRSVILSKLLLPDIHHSQEVGASWHDEGLDFKMNSVGNFLHDEFKVILLFAQMHYYRHLYPAKKIIFNFFDDRSDILNSVYGIFSTYRELIPEGLLLNLYQHRAGKAIEPHGQSIQGKQKQQLNFRYFTWALAELLGNFQSQVGSTEINGADVINQIANNPGGLDLFLKSSYERPYCIDKTELSFGCKEVPVADQKSMVQEPLVEMKEGSNASRAWSQWLEEQCLGELAKTARQQGLVVYVHGLAWCIGAKHSRERAIKSLQTQGGLSRDYSKACAQLKLAYQFTQMAEAKNMSSHDHCRRLHQMILETRWNTKKGGEPAEVGILTTIVPKTIYLMLQCIGDPDESNKNWDVIFQQIQTAAEGAARSQPRYGVLFGGGKRDELTQTFYELLGASFSAGKSSPSLRAKR